MVNSYRGFLQLFPRFVLALVLVYSILAFSFYLIKSTPCLFFENIYFYSLFFLLSSLFFFVNTRSILQKNKINIHMPANRLHIFFGVTVTAAVIFFLVYYYRLQYWDLLPVWLDEYIQAFVLDYYPSCSIMKAAALQQQPPIDYILHQLSRYVFEDSLLGVRINSMIFSTLSVFLLLGLMEHSGVKRYFSFPAIVLYIIHPLFVFYSLEARPISLSVCILIVFLWFVVDFLRETESSTQAKVNLFVSLLVYLTTIGLQPIVVCIVLFLASLILCFFNEKKGKSLAIYLVAANLLSLPVFFLIYKESQGAKQFYETTVLGNFEKLLSSFFTYKEKEFFLYFDLITENILDTPRALFLLYVLMFVFFLVRRRLNRVVRIQLLYVLLLTLFSFSFVWIFESVWSLINWSKSIKYISNIYPILLFLLTLLLSSFFQKIKGIYEFGLGALAAALLIWSLLGSEQHLKYVNIENYSRADWRGLKTILDSDKRKKIVFDLPYSLVGYYSLAIPPKSLLAKNHQTVKLCKSFNLAERKPYSLDCNNETGEGRSIYFIINQRLKSGKNFTVLFNKMSEKYQTYQLKNIFVIQVSSEKKLGHTVAKVLRNIVELDRFGEQNTFILFMLMNYYLSIESLEDARWCLDTLRGLNLRPVLNTHFSDFDYMPQIKTFIEYWEREFILHQSEKM